MVDSDSEGESGIQNCYIQMANPVDLSSYSAVNLQWTQYYRHFQDPHFVEVSTDGGANWTSFEVNTELGSSVNSDNPDYGLVNISSAAAGQAQVWIRFRYEGAWGWFWCVDDVAITESFANDLVVLQVFHGDIVNDLEYSRLPLEQAHEVVAGVIIKNNGAEEQTNVNVAWEVVTASGVVANGTDQTLTSSASGSIDTLWIQTGYTPDVLGQVTVNVTVTADAADEVPGDNEGSSFMVITEYDYGHDEDSEWDVFTGGYTDANQTTVSYEHGVVVVGYNAGSTITGVKAAFGPDISANGTTSFTVNVYRDDGQIELLSETIWDVNVTVADQEYTTIVLDDPVVMEEGLVYIVTIGVEAGEDMYFYGNSTDDDFASRLYGPLGAGGAVGWYFNGRSPAIQAVVDPFLCIAPSSYTVHYSCGEFTWNGQSYTESGLYSYQTETPSGCDSIAYLDLNIVSMIPAQIDDYLCNNEPITINNVTYNQVGTYTQVLAGSNGCDTLLSINLTQGVEPNIYQSEVICGSEPVLINGVSYNQAGNFTQTFPGVNGCDTILNISLTANPDPQAVILGNVAITPSSVYTYGFVNPGGYSVTWGAVNGIILDGQGTNTVSIFWDASGGGEVVLTLSNGTCTFEYYLSVGNFVNIRELAESDVRIYPNPVENELLVNLQNLSGHAEMTLLDAQGRMVYKKPLIANMSSTTSIIDMSGYPLGLYILLIEADNGSIVKKFVKE
jgi:hypothetical protein